jgi:hypothetical protein
MAESLNVTALDLAAILVSAAVSERRGSQETRRLEHSHEEGSSQGTPPKR